MAPKTPHPSGWSTKRYILAALVGTLMATTIVIAVSAIFRPDKISFSVTDDALTRPSKPADSMSLNLTVTATTGDRSSVQYSSLIVYLLFTQEGTDYELPVGLVGPLPLPQPPDNTTDIRLACHLWGVPSGGTPMITVQVLAVVRFKVGLLHTRPYNIKVFCGPVDFIGRKNLSFPIACNA
uniref:Uncharacterized protein n=1 Tax=Avena sativa TaxID=4498 RepID=A0ACD5ZR08_AVESA